MRFDILNRLGVNHQCDKQTDGRTDRRTDGRMDRQNRVRTIALSNDPRYKLILGRKLPHLNRFSRSGPINK